MELENEESEINYIINVAFPQEYLTKKLIENDFVYNIFKNKSSIIYSTTVILEKIYKFYEICNYYYKYNCEDVFFFNNFPKLFLNVIFDDFYSLSIYKKLFYLYSYIPLNLIGYHICDLLPKTEKQDREQSRIVLLNIVYNTLSQIIINYQYFKSSDYYNNIHILLMWFKISTLKNNIDLSYFMTKILKKIKIKMELKNEESAINYIINVAFPQEYLTKKLIENDFVYNIFKNKSSIIYSTITILEKIYDYHCKSDHKNLFFLNNFPQLFLKLIFDDFNSSSIFKKIFCTYSLYIPLKLIEYHICDLLPKTEKQDREQSRIVLLNIIYNVVSQTLFYTEYYNHNYDILMLWFLISYFKNSFDSSYLSLKLLI